MLKTLICLWIVVTLAGLWPAAAVAAQGTAVQVVPASLVIGVGATVTVEVQVHDVLDLYAVDLHLAFDPALLEVQDADGNPANGVQVAAGGFLSSPYGFTAANGADNSTGQIRYVYSLLSPAAPVSGSGVLVRITFLARNPGSSPLQLQALLANDHAGYISALVSDGLIVVSGDTATPTVTAFATRTATLTVTRTPTRTTTLTPTATRSSTPFATFTPSRTPTRTRTATPTPILTATRTGTPPVLDRFLWLPLLLRDHWVAMPTPTRSATPMPTLTPAPTASVTPTVEGTPSPSPTADLTPAATPSLTPTPAPSATPSATPIASPSPTGTITPEVTYSPTPSSTGSVTPSPTATVTPAGATPSPTPGSRQLLLNPGFETDGAWALESDRPAYTMVRAHTGLRSMRLGIILPSSVPVYTSIWQEVDLPGQMTDARLSLYYFPVGWPEDTDLVYLSVTRASDGTTLFSDHWMRWEQTWHSYTVDLLSRLHPYAGQRIRLRIGVKNDGDGMTAVYLDDVELSVTSIE